VAHSWNPSYTEDGDRRITVGGQPGQNSECNPVLKNKPGMVANVCGLSFVEAYIGRRITVRGWPQAKARPFLKNK
jgi:hypothetical protein